MKKNLSRTIALILSSSMLCGGCIFALASGNNDTHNNEPIQQGTTVLNTSKDEINTTKSETVYVIASADGTAQKVIVSGWLKNENKLDALQDNSSLSDIENVKSDNSYTIDKDGMIVWDAQGNDVHYRGNSDSTLPVDLKISYELDGKAIAPSELASKNGKLKISISYINNKKNIVTINGKDETIYAPYLMLTGMAFDNNKVSNISVTNGKMFNSGEKTFVAGFALPGMQESLGIDSDKFEIPQTITIEADVKDFSLATTVTLAINDMFTNISVDDNSDLNNIKDSFTELDDAMKKLCDGSSQLYNGLFTLSEKSGELIDGINLLYQGSSSLYNGASALNDGMNDLNTGITALNSGLDELSSNSEKLVSGAEQIFNVLLETANSQISASIPDAEPLTRTNYNTVIDAITSSLTDENIRAMAYNEARKVVKENVEAKRDIIVESVKDAILEQILAQAGNPMSASDYRNALNAGMIPPELAQAIDAQMNSEQVKAIIESKVSEQIDLLIEQAMNSDEVVNKINTAVNEGIKSRESLVALKGQLNSYNEFYNGLKNYTNGVDSAYAGSKQLAEGSGKATSGTKSLLDGIKQLNDGISALKNGCKPLTEGINKLVDGSKELNDGLNRFNDEGIQKLLDIYNDDIKSLKDRLNAMSDLAEKEHNFSGNSENGSVKYIYRTDSIGE